jgi:murein DD-endopeptidase MepM/ murein hydrolase activator NlpD
VWAPQGDTCYFPVDLLAKGTLRLERKRGAERDTATVKVGAYPYPEQRLTVDDRMVHLSPADEARAAREAERVAPLWQRETRARFALPLRPPLAELPAGGHFGARRVLNNEPRSPHAGVDYSTLAGTPVLAVADGVVVLAEEHFFSGQSVYVDHGGGLISCYFHLSRTDVKTGDEVRGGGTLGAVGATGRAPGPHLHFAVRWHGARVNPAVLLGRPAAILALE